MHSIHRKSILWALVAGLWLAFCPPASYAGGQEIWLGARLGFRQTTPTSDPNDFWEMFATPNTKWPKAQKRVRVMEIGLVPMWWWAYAKMGLTTPDWGKEQAYIDQPQYLPKVLRFLHDNHIKLAIGVEVVKGPKHLEGVDPHASVIIEAMCAQIKRDGGTVDYVDMDEPLCFGHYDNGGPGYSIDDLFAPDKGDIQESTNVVKKYFPHAAFIDTEPFTTTLPCQVGASGQPQYIEDNLRWVADWKKHVGSPISAMHVDLWWNESLRAMMPLVYNKVLAPSGIAFGVIYNGDNNSKTDEEEMAECRTHFQQWKNLALPAPDHIVIEGWYKHPVHNLPETDPGAFVSLVNWCATGSPGSVVAKGAAWRTPWGADGHQIGACMSGPSSIDCYFKKVFGGLWHQEFRDGQWKRASRVEVDIAAGPELVGDGSGAIDVYYTASDSTVRHLTETRGALGPEENLGGSAIGAPTVVARDMFYRGPDNILYLRSKSDKGWSKPSNQGFKVYSDVAALQASDGSTDLFYTNLASALKHRSLRFGHWSSEEALPGMAIGAPAVIARGNGMVDLYYRGWDNRLMHLSGSARSWSQPAALGVFTLSNPVVFSLFGNSVELLYRGQFDKGTTTLKEIRWDGKTWSSELSAGTERIFD